MLPMLRQASLLDTPWTLLYTGRSRTAMAYVDELGELGGTVIIRDRASGPRFDLAAAVAEQPAGTKIYCCGPEELIGGVEAAGSGLPRGHVRIERFIPKDAGAPARTTPFEVVLDRTGITITVAPDQSVLDAVRAAGANLISSCRQGVCGTCETEVLDGIPDHRD